MIILQEYDIVENCGIYYAKSKENPVCPICGAALKVRDSRKRKLIQNEHEMWTFQVRRLVCQSCGRIHVELPNLFFAYKHYAREIIEKEAGGEESGCDAACSTIYRWKHQPHE